MGGAAAWDHSQFTTSPPVYPSPNMTGAGGWDAALAKARDFLAEMTLEEKAFMVTGTTGPCAGNIAPIERLNFTGLCLQDGPLAIRQAIYASVFPAQLTAAASWDRDLIYKRGLYLGEEFKGKGAQIALGPVVGPIGRSPYGGRNWEGFSTDPYLSGVGVELTVAGIQDAGVQAVTKHYIGNEQETQRNPSVSPNGARIESISSNIDDRTMHELYLWPFYNAVRAGTASIMCSYNRLNGSYGCENSKSINGLLKEELGFQGYVMSDWTGTHSGVPAIEAGLEMNMPGGIAFSTPTPSYFGGNITIAVNNGSLAESRVDDMVLRILTPYFHLNQDADFPPVDESSATQNSFTKDTWVHDFALGPTVDVRSDEHTKLIRDLAAAGTVLLKNVDGALPLNAPKQIAVFGNDAADFSEGLYSFAGGFVSGSYDIGTLAAGGGSGTGRFSYLVSPLDAIKARAKQDNALVQYILNNEYITTNGFTTIAPEPEVCLVFIKAWATEGFDRESLLPDYNGSAVVETVAANCNNTIVVLHGTGPVVLPFANHENVTAILAAHMPGQESGNSLVDVLYGDVNPSGHLPYTVPVSEDVVPSTAHIVNSTALAETEDPLAWEADFEEGLLIDYRYYYADDKAAKEKVLYPFGYGLSYTTFELADLSTGASNTSTTNSSASASTIAPPGGRADLWAPAHTVRFQVRNTGARAGAAVPQLYVGLSNAGAPSGTPRWTLRGFEKVQLDAGEEKEVVLTLAKRDVAFWDTVSQDWVVPQGEIEVALGWSAGELLVKDTL
ncbi:glycoside hydrolase family 3 protein [Aplosporella prunicola CBS 121167]|uniref:Probable beta-glucosidase G n=1 Tax=Aplosporella prunicola CBS 121167 TaxID=1176127 RepID=A0A6A6BC71_9PEZI|nr:glycoside hydrolase family 3 protein [Aplosporella prunicola CBS 121167]KAF2140973.1 glycoside hydrolase family 3 protein [Aplosporella prunicola CBS 121167]